MSHPRDKIADDLAQSQPDWVRETAAFRDKADAAQAEVLAEDDPKIGDEQKTQIEATLAFRMGVQELADERERLIGDRSYLINVLGVDPSELEPIDSAEALKALHEAHPLLKAGFGSPDDYEQPEVKTTSPFPPPLTDAAKQKVLDEAVDDLIEEVTKIPGSVDVPEEPVRIEPPSYQWDQNPRGKDSNPKDAIGSRKAGLSMLPRQVLYEVGLGMLEGALKYARHNYRIAGVRASVYKDACDRHMDAWWEGQDIDPGSGLHHVVKAIASLVVLRDSMLAGNWYDDRPPSIGDPNWLDAMNKEAERIIDEFEGEPKKPYIKGDNE